jgi:hypothetical protein
MAASHEAAKISDLVEREPEWTLTNNASLAVTDFSFASQRTVQENPVPTPPSASSTSAFTVNAWNAYFAGWIPNTHFFYYSELDIVAGGNTSPEMANAHVGYTGGSARNSWCAIVGREHLQISEGTRAAQIYSLLPSAPLVFENLSPTNFRFDQSPVGAEGMYTWSSTGYKRVLGITGKVTNGDNADGSEALTASNRNGKDFWANVDFWYAPESGISFVTYSGRKNQIQNLGAANEFTFYPHIRREGVFGNYMIGRDKVDLLAGYMHADDDWEDPSTAVRGSYTSNGYFVEANYYLWRGFALAGRYDRLKQELTGIPQTHLEQWQVGAEKAFTPEGNVIGRISVGKIHGADPLSLLNGSTRTFQADLQFNY